MPKDYNIIWSVIKLILALPIVILLACISLRLTNKYLYKQNRGKNVQILEKIPINNKASICTIKVGEEYIVMGVSENTFYKIKTLDTDETKGFIEKNKEEMENTLMEKLNKFKKGNSKYE